MALYHSEKIGGGTPEIIELPLSSGVFVRYGKMRMIMASTGSQFCVNNLYDDLSIISKAEHPILQNAVSPFGVDNSGNRYSLCVLRQANFSNFGKNGFIIYKNEGVASPTDTSNCIAFGQLIWVAP